MRETGRQMRVVALLVMGLLLFSPARLTAGPVASIVVLSPSGVTGDVVPEGEDYFTLVLGDPRDMNQRLDLRFQYPNVTGISLADGMWYGYGGSYVYPLFSGLGGAANIGQAGGQPLLDGTRFRRFSVRAGHNTDGNVRLTYFTGLLTDPGEAGTYPLATDGMHTVWWDASLPSNVTGLRLGISGNPFVVDWIRLTDPETSPVYTITWSVSGVSYINIYGDTDTDPSVLDHRIASWVDATGGSYIWETGYLAPGTYYVYIEDAQNPATAAYSPGPLTIQPAPVAQVTAPSRTSGNDYATVELGNPWDMSDSADVTFMYHLASVSFSDGALNATTTGVDPYIHLRDAGPNSIETDYYHYLTWRFYVEGDWADSRLRLNSKTDRWGVSRLFLDTLEADYNTFNDVIPWEGWTTYQMDLAYGDGRGYLDDAAPGPGAGWNGLRSLVRLDFLEPVADDRWRIHLDSVLLTADPRPQEDGTYVIAWQITQGVPITTTLFYDTSPDSVCEGGTFIARIVPQEPQPPVEPFRAYLPLVLTGQFDASAQQYVWESAGGLAAGEYYIGVLLDDGLSQTCWVGDAPLVIDP